MARITSLTNGGPIIIVTHTWILYFLMCIYISINYKARGVLYVAEFYVIMYVYKQTSFCGWSSTFSTVEADWRTLPRYKTPTFTHAILIPHRKRMGFYKTLSLLLSFFFFTFLKAFSLKE